jgi:formylglycine-generating enzyme required for sulfatase activity
MSQDSHPLEPGSRIDNLRIVRVLGRGAYGITYLVNDPVLGSQFALKEYFPQSQVSREQNGAVQVLEPADESIFRQGMAEFLSEGRMLAGLQHAHIINVFRCFEANNTAYLQMPYYQGEPLNQLLERNGPLNQEELEALLFPLLDALQYLHKHSVIHQDIKPSNIYITSSGEPLLLDFGTARQLATSGRGSSHGSPGYAAPEQELGTGPVGPWTDIYGMAACVYRALTGTIPASARQRTEALKQGLKDPLGSIDQHAIHPFSAEWLAALSKGLGLQADSRPRTVSDWLQLFDRKPGKTRRSVLEPPARQSSTKLEYDTEGRAWLPIILLGIFAIALGILVFYLFVGSPVEQSGKADLAPTAEQEAIQSVRPSDPEQSRRWQEALEADTLYAYQRFMQDYPQSIHEPAARQHMERLDDTLWQKVDAEGTRSAYESYLEQLPQGRHEAEAMIQLDLLDRLEAEEQRQKTQRQQEDDLAWNEAKMQRSISAIDRYIAEFPDGSHLQDAQTLKRELSDAANDSTAFGTAKKLNTRNAYQAYIDAFPRGKHITEALSAIDELTLRPGKRFRDCERCPDLLVLAPGSFWQGAEEDSLTALANEKPQRKVVIDRPFAIGIHEVTMAQWDACVAAAGCTTQPTDNGWGRGARPVIMVSWNDAQSYVEWLSKETGERYRLPSESEWEYAARAGETDEWPGADPAGICKKANIAGSETGFRWAHTACADNYSLETSPVASFQANDYGLYDSLGNVAEWTLDCMSLSYLDAPADGSANNRGLCNSRVTRGGSWFSGARESRLTARFNLKAGDRNDFTGFRVVRELPGID